VDSLINAAIVVLPTAYLAAAVGYATLFYARNARGGLLGSICFRVAVLLHIGFLVLLTLRWAQYPAATVAQALTVTALAVAVVYLFLEWYGRERSTGLWILSLIFLFQLLSSLTWTSTPPDLKAFHSPWFGVHVSLALCGYAAFTLSGGYGFLFLRLYRELKQGHFQTFFNRLPPLEVLDRMMTGALVAGFILFSGAIVAGAAWAESLSLTRWFDDPWSVVTLATWVLYGAALTLRRLRRWQARQTAIASLVGIAAILISLLAVNFLTSGFHGFD
jgi:ABC-type transport system involved in cytochrome c biogenesis permease subunit